MLFNGIIGKRQFKTDDDSFLDRLNKVYNQIKYLESYSEHSQFKGHGSFQALVRYQNEGSSMKREDIGDLSTTPRWITNDGIECKMCVISFAALSKQITEYCDEAEACAIYDVKKHRQEVITEEV
jgi:hypothetical protein